jgi:membrane-associated phospholipid phosphatase
MRERLADLISNIFNPFLVSFVTILLLALDAVATVNEALKWALICLALSVLPVIIVVFYLVSRKKLEGVFSAPRRQRHTVYAVSAGLAAIGCGLLWYMDAPRLLAATFTAGLAAIIIFMLINFFWKISLHTAFISAAAVSLVMIYGTALVWTILLVPLVAWSRLELKMHSFMQVVAGAIVAGAIVVAVFKGFGVG